MKKIILTWAMFLGSLTLIWSQTNSLEDFFNTYRDDPSFTLVTISPKLFQMFSELDLDEESEEVKEVISSINSLRILARDEQDGRQLYREAISQITRSDYEELLTVRDGDENVNFLIREGSSSNIINQLVLLVGGSDSFVLLDISGNIDLKSIGKLGSTLDIPGAEHLEKVGDKN